jgi:hypothetical protein
VTGITKIIINVFPELDFFAKNENKCGEDEKTLTKNK